jgi:ribonuclease HIII
MNKYEKYTNLKQLLVSKGAEVETYKEIAYGLQFGVSKEYLKGTVRVYESKKKGLTVDLSQIKEEGLKVLFFEDNTAIGVYKQTPEFKSDDLDVSLIGVDESGKGDYFGPLVVAGVYATKDQKIKLMQMGVADSKKLSDLQINKLAKQIKEICPYDILILKNQKYNDLYAKIKNLNKLLAWGHARVIENILAIHPCNYALSDQFAKEGVIESALMEKGKKIVLEQRPRAEQNVVVAAASILARDAFVCEMESLSTAYGIEFPKGAGEGTLRTAKKFITKYDKSKLGEVCKLHFKTTESL